MSDEIYYHVGRIILILAFIYIILRAYYLSITYDEAYTYLMYATKSYFGIFSEGSIANNHFLNTVLIKFFVGIFGVSEFVVRIPALIGASIYLISAYYISKLLFSKYYFLASVSLLVSNALLMDFLPLARGYSLAIGCFMVALYFLLKEERNGIVILMCTLAVLSSLSFLYIYAAFILLLTYRELGDVRSMASRVILPVGCSALFLFFTLFSAVRWMQRAEQFYFGGTAGFWQDTVQSLISYTLYDNLYNIILIEISRVIVMVLSGLALLAAYRTREKRLLILSFILVIVILLIHIHHALGTRFILDRAAIFFIPLFTLLIVLAWQAIPSRLTGAFFSIIIALVLFNFIMSINISHTLAWKYNANTEDAIIEMINDYKIGQKKIGITWLYDSAVNFYRVKYNLTWLEPATRDGPDELCDYYLIMGDPNMSGVSEKYVLNKYNVSYKYYPLSNSYFAKKKMDSN
jgi:hypothetical protein